MLSSLEIISVHLVHPDKGLHQSVLKGDLLHHWGELTNILQYSANFAKNALKIYAPWRQRPLSQPKLGDYVY
jgi:hypothetical protein